jgi:hypothetical protein
MGHHGEAIPARRLHSYEPAPEVDECWSKIGAKIVSHGRYVAFQIAALGDGNMNAQPAPVREKRWESTPLAVQPIFWKPGGPMPSPSRAEPMLGLPGTRKNDGITWRCLEKMANPGLLQVRDKGTAE